MEVASFLSQITESTTRLFRRLEPGSGARPELRAVRKYSYGPFLFECQVPAGLDYLIQASTDFKVWGAVQTGCATEGWFEVVDSAAAEFTRRFYRVAAGGVRSAGVVGFLSVCLSPGYTLIANPLLGGSNRIGTLLSQMPEGTRFAQFDPLLYRFTENRVVSGRWQRPDERLEPGYGAILFNPTSESIVRCFAGQALTGRQLTSLLAGFSLRSSLLPLEGRLDLDLGFPMAPGDVIHVFDRTAQSYTVHEYGPDGWRTPPPTIAAGESFWAAKETAAQWTQELPAEPLLTVP